MEKRKYLYYNLNKIDKNKNNLIYNYIIDNEIDHGENNNCIILNLSTLSDNYIDEIYNLYNLKTHKIDYILPPPKQNIIKKNKKIYPKYECSKLEKLIISYS